MQEHFLYYIWKFKKFNTSNITTQIGEPIEIVSVGEHNLYGGPDFFNAQLKIDNQLWAGNVEIHLKSSDWFLHNHEQDKAYDNVILHVVWEHDMEVFRKDNSTIPTLEIKNYVFESVLKNYNTLFSKNYKWINCENDFHLIDSFVLNNWLERLYFERLEQKAETINTLLKQSKNNWEAVLFKMLSKNFGLNVNGDAFLSLAQSIDFSLVRKTQNNQQTLEALLIGQAGLLENDIQNGYYIKLKDEYLFLKKKFKLDNSQVVACQFFRLRPSNFPTLRLSQLAMLYSKQQNLFSKIITGDTLDWYYNLFSVSSSLFWKTHYTFEKTSKSASKTLTKPFIDLLLINTILPVKFCHAKQKGENIDELVVNLSSIIQSEKNSIITAFNRLKKVSNSALHSQALIELRTNYCIKNKCLQCAIGNLLLNK